ncbi:linear amide C-N hydrolase [Ferrimonas pelagia]|uniref:Choloylglycine hydrolase/NAAA C-terminal domain-containing protein n=1 Tax=Ferrimonas pelagia TaxID=1177826 RepID=A0ABP9EV26_9GAMM
MCTRILNNLNRQFAVVGRNMDWARPLNCHLYRMPRGERRAGLTPAQRTLSQANLQQVSPDLVLKSRQVLKWRAKYASIVSMLGDRQLGYASVDGINDQGLTVCALFDSDASFAPVTPASRDCLGALCWPQHLLDRFANVAEAVAYYDTTPPCIIAQWVPEAVSPELARSAMIHLAISDREGNSAIIELCGGKFVIHQSSSYRVVTNQPNYQTQLKLLYYWEYQWGLTDPQNLKPSYTVPGGVASTQNLERGAYYVSLAEPAPDRSQAVAQTRGMIATCAEPLWFNRKAHDAVHSASSFTRWTNLADAHGAVESYRQQGEVDWGDDAQGAAPAAYYLLNAATPAPVWLNFANLSAQCQRVALIIVERCGQSLDRALAGDLQAQLQDCDEPYPCDPPTVGERADVAASVALD